MGGAVLNLVGWCGCHPECLTYTKFTKSVNLVWMLCADCVYSAKSQHNLTGMSERDVEDIRTTSDRDAMMRFVIERIYSTPSMVDKLPKYMMERVYRVVEWSERNGWE